MRTKSKHFDLNLLRVFVAAYRSQSVTKAADELDMTQSAVSNALARLKEGAGQELFSRTGRGIKPTRFAQDLYQRVSMPLLDIERSLSGIETFEPEQSLRSFEVYCNEGLLYILQQVLQDNPMPEGLEVIVKELPPTEQEIYEHLSDDRVDLVLDVIKPSSRIYQSQLLTDNLLCCVVRKDHPRLTQDTISKESYMAEKHAMLNLRRHSLSFVGMLVSEVLPMRKVYSEHASLVGIMGAVSQSEAVGTVPMHLAKQYKDIFNLDILPFPFEENKYHTYLVWNTRLSDNSANQWLREHVTKVMHKALGIKP
ncbi:transcriptional regulator, lysR family [Vibrio ishigakensis]|uniref:Transcriptional regulator, lysR family n=1 Tax=Vibrio ishigakensis TaxID=1481914 RepID=A0A0B8NW99_9VIBR|nr:LysR family transcriptional regulator [Vibrio ishigakensis]GAM54989.1 transcriptional regulator, lysR family [Vibrio ishigakensis]